METKTKVILIVTGAFTAVGVGLAIFLHRQKQRREQEELLEAASRQTSVSGNSLTTSGSNATNESSEYSDEVSPTFNREDELSNPYSQLKGRTLYPKPKGVNNGLGYTNVRSSARVNDSDGWWGWLDVSDNQLTTISGETPIGKIEGETTEVVGGYGYRWFKVWLMHKVGFWGTTHGYVRADTVTFKPYSR